VEFPYKNSFSIIAGIIKVYPKIEQYIQDNNLKTNEIMEIYDVPSNKIIYLMRK
jgi:predicted XRE-type DNA-binding protein